MSDLISRSEVINLIESKFVDGCLMQGEKTLIDGYGLIDEVSELPTAFDTEKAVEEIKKLDLDGVSMVEDGKYKLVRRNEVISLIQTNGVCNGRQKSCKYCYKKDCPLSTEKTLSDKWSDIVKKGGME